MHGSITRTSIASDEASTSDHSTTMNVPTFEELYAQYHEYVRMRVCVLLHYQSSHIDDAIQRTWIRVWQALPKLTSTANLKAWLYIIATNTVRDAMRQQKHLEAHYYSIEATLERFEVEPDNYRNAIAPDPHEYIPEQLERQALRAKVWNNASAKDRQTFAAYVANEEIADINDLYAARRNFHERYKRAEKRVEVAS